MYKYFTMVQSFEAFIEEKTFNNSCLMDFLDVVPVPVCVQYISSTCEIEESAEYCWCRIAFVAMWQLLSIIYFYPAISTFAVQICNTNKVLLYSY